MQYKCRKKN